MLADGPLAQPPLVGWRQVRLLRYVLARCRADHRQRLGEMNVRDICGNVRHREGGEGCFQTQFGTGGNHPPHGTGGHRHHLEVVVNEPHLGIKRHELVEVAGRVMRFGPEGGSRFKDAFQRPHHHLLVELRALGEVGGLPEVVQLEDIGAALRCRADDLRRGDFSEALGSER